MLRRNFSSKIRIDNVLKYLELATKVVAIIIIIATVIGGLNIYSYLKDINHLFLFSDVVGISYASISALVSYFLFISVVSIGFLSPFIIPISILLISNENKENNNQANKETNKNPQSVFNPSQNLLKFTKHIKSLFLYPVLYTTPIFIALGVAILPIILSIFIVCFLPFFVMNLVVQELFFGQERNLSFEILSKFIHWISFLCTLSIVLIMFFGNRFSEYLLYAVFLFFISISFLYTRLFTKNIYSKKGLGFEKSLSIITLSFFSILPSLLHFLFVVYPTVNVVKYEITSILFYILSIFLFGLSCFLSHSAIYDYFQDKMFFRDKKYDGKLIIVNFIPIFIYVLYLSYFSDYNMSLYAPRFIEKPKNSSWYLIHNGNTTSENINGFSKNDILSQKEIFNAKDCSALKNQDKCKDDNQEVFNNRDNALYGYMAWNLGSTKVFCPVSVDFFDNKGNNKENSKKCLVIDGKYLQPISEHYIAK